MALINDTISDRAHEIYKNLFNLRSQSSWGHLPVNDEMFNFFENIQNYTGPVTEILEIGTNLGFSAMMQLQSNPNANLTTFDINPWKVHGARMDMTDPFLQKITAQGLLKLMYGDRIEYKIDSSLNIIKYPRLLAKNYSYVFIDGDHTYDGARKDIKNALEFLNTKYILIDNLNISEVSEAVKTFLNINIIEELCSINYTQKRYTHDNSDDMTRLDKLTLYRKI